MAVSYAIDKERKLVLSVGSGVLTKEDILAHQQRLLKDADFEPSFAQISNFTAVTETNLNAADVRAIAAATIFSARSRRALLVSTNEQFELGRMFASLREAHGEYGVRVFRDREEAMNWALSMEASQHV